MILLILSAAALASQQADSAATKAAILAADRNLAAAEASRGPEALIDVLDPSAAVLIPGQPILKASDARTALLARYTSPSRYTWTPVHAVASTDGKLGCTMGYSRFISAADTSHADRRGIYLTCWKKNQDGQWRIIGTERADNVPQAPKHADHGILPDAPHSASVTQGSGALDAAQDADSIFAAMGSDAAGPGPAFAKYAADDAVLLGGDEFPRGPGEISAAFQGYPPDRVITWGPTRSFGMGTGGLAFTVGHSVSGPRPGKTGPSNAQKYFTVWRQEPDGRWLYIFDLGTPRPAGS
ncbi:MAG TPA: nuclear transport factor 2 family protein [Gemmatimonadaceae bacterium]